jgi:hypothetical protein
MKLDYVQQRSQEWHNKRAGKVTGTSLKDVFGSAAAQKTLLYKLVSDKMSEVVINGRMSADMERGVELEPFALKAVREKTNTDFKEVGLLTGDIEGFAVSPDGCNIYLEEYVNGGCEIKCPGNTNHLRYIVDGIPKDYYYQVRAPFLLSEEVKWWTFVSFNPNNYDHPMYLETVYREEYTKLDEDREKLIAFIDKVNKLYEDLTF